MDTTFANTCRLVFHVVIEEENWGGASVEGKRELGIVALEDLGGIVWLLASLWIWGQNALTAIIGLFFYFFFITCCELWRKRHKKNKATKIGALNGSDSQNTI